jgi:ParB family chromosome partitioning protein
MENSFVIKEINIECIIPDPNQPRKYFDETKIRDLAETIKQQGLLQPILVRPLDNGKYQLIHGERRFRACKSIGMNSIKAEIRELTDKEVMEIQLIENIQRVDFCSIEEAKMYERMVNEFHYTHEDIAKKISVSREYVTNKIRLLKLPASTQQSLIEGKITESQARLMITLEEEKQLELVEKITSRKLNVKETEAFVKSNVSRETSHVGKNDLVIGIWVSPELYSQLEKIAKSQNTNVENICPKLLEGAINDIS